MTTELPPRMVLEARGITKRFSGVLANDGVDLVVGAGEIHVLIGENGAGKTTLMNVCYGLERPDAGAVLVNGAPVVLRRPADALRRGIAMVHQHFMLVPVFSVVENVILGIERTGPLGVVEYAEARRRLRALADRYGLPVDPDVLVETLSVGEQQRVEILKALYRDARILVLDEPTAALTPQETTELFRVLRALADDGVGIVLITHKLGEALEIGDRITVMRRGRVVGTRLPRDTDAGELATLMVGRPVALVVNQAPPLPNPPPRGGEGTFAVPPREGEGTVSGAAVLRVSELVVRDARGLEAVDGVSFEVYAGEILGIAGVQGNGQTELVEALVGLRAIDRGSVTWPGEIRGRPSPRAIRVGGTAHIPEDRQRDGLVASFSLADNLILCTYRMRPFARWGIRWGSVIRSHARALLEAFDVRPRNELAAAASLSGGNQQKVILARELTKGVRLVVANQPTRGLDVGAIEEVHRRLVELRDAGTAVLLVSTELDELRALADRIAVLYRGRIMATLAGEATTAEQLGLLMAGIGSGD